MSADNNPTEKPAVQKARDIMNEKFRSALKEFNSKTSLIPIKTQWETQSVLDENGDILATEFYGFTTIVTV